MLRTPSGGGWLQVAPEDDESNMPGRKTSRRARARWIDGVEEKVAERVSQRVTGWMDLWRVVM